MTWSERTSRTLGWLWRAGAGVVCLAVCAGVAPGAANVAGAATVAACPPNPTSTIEEIVSWRRADVVTARLANGVLVHHRRMPDAGFTIVAGTLAPGFDDEAVGVAAARAAEAILSADDRARGLKINVMAVEQGLLAVIRGSDERSRDMCGLIARLASEPVEFDAANAGALGGSTRSVVRRATDAVLDQRPLVIRPGPEMGGGARLRWPEGKASGSVEIAIVGGVEMVDALTSADAALGLLSPRQAPVPAAVDKAPARRTTQVLTIHSNEMNLPAGREAVAVGVLVRNGETLAGQRTIALGATLLRRQLQDMAQQEGAEFSNAWVDFEPRGLRPGSAVVTITGSCAAGQGEPVAARFHEAFKTLAAPAEADAFEWARSAYIDQTRRLLGDVTYWAKVLACCSTRGYTPDELAGVEPDLKAITPAEVARVMTNALVESGPITIYVRPPSAPESARPAEKVGQP